MSTYNSSLWLLISYPQNIQDKLNCKKTKGLFGYYKCPKIKKKKKQPVDLLMSEPSINGVLEVNL